MWGVGCTGWIFLHVVLRAAQPVAVIAILGAGPKGHRRDRGYPKHPHNPSTPCENHGGPYCGNHCSFLFAARLKRLADSELEEAISTLAHIIGPLMSGGM